MKCIGTSSPQNRRDARLDSGQTAASERGGDAMKKSLWQGAAAAALGAILGMAVASPAAALDKLRVGKAIALPFDFTPVDIGMEKGFFQEHGLTLEITSFAGSAKLQQALGADAIDVGLGSGPELAFVAKGNTDLGICAYAGPVNLMLVVRPDAGINSVADLKGKRITVSTVGSLTDWVVRETSRQQGWGNDGILVTPLGTNEAQVAAMRAKQTDGLAIDPAGAYELEEKGAGKIILAFSKIAPDFINHVAYATNKMIAEHPEQLKEFLAAWFETVAFMKANKDETVKLAAPIMHQSTGIAARDYDVTMPTFSDTGKFEAKPLAVLARSFVQMGALD